MRADLLETVASWPSLLLVVVVFGFAPGFCLRLIVLIYPRSDPRRTELIAELYAVPRIERPLWVAEQLEVALFEGLPRRLSAALRWFARWRRARVQAAVLGAVLMVVLPLADRIAGRTDQVAGRTLAISDLVLQNPSGDSGMHVMRVAGQGEDQQETVLLEVGLDNFLDLDYHFFEPLRFKPGEKIMLAVNCQNPPPPGDRDEAENCRPSASFSGYLEDPALTTSLRVAGSIPLTTEP
ncbi:MAG TPA: hypothetical protein VFQ77_20620 [Pseudonocardiaceae bacterium]|nr:hypothetical protein [Pseudonocardiaceae bacterium]